MDAITQALKKAKHQLVGKVAEAACVVLDGWAVSVTVTLREHGAAKPTFSTLSWTAWGEPMLRLASEEQQVELGEHHMEQALKALQENVGTMRARMAEVREARLRRDAKDAGNGGQGPGAGTPPPES